MDWSRATVLTDEEFLAAWDALGLGPVPLDLEVSIPPPVEAAAEYAAALAQLRRRGLAGDSGPGDTLAGSLRALATAPVALDLRLSDGLVVLGAIDGERGALLLVDDTAEPGLYLLPVAGPRVAATLVRLAGALTPGELAPVTVPSEVLDGARAATPDGGYWDLAARLSERGVPEQDAHLLSLMCTGITSAGQFFATARVGGKARPSRWLLAFHRSAAGDFVQLRRPSGPGSAAVTIAPATAEGLLARLDEMVADLGATHPPIEPGPG